MKTLELQEMVELVFFRPQTSMFANVAASVAGGIAEFTEMARTGQEATGQCCNHTALPRFVFIGQIMT
jgi:hypothetical protein